MESLPPEIILGVVIAAGTIGVFLAKLWNFEPAHIRESNRRRGGARNVLANTQWLFEDQPDPNGIGDLGPGDPALIGSIFGDDKPTD